MEWASRWPGEQGREGGGEREREGEEEGDERIGRIENRRAIRETQQKDSITSHKESKPSGEINKRSPLLSMKAQKRKKEKTDEEERERTVRRGGRERGESERKQALR